METVGNECRLQKQLFGKAEQLHRMGSSNARAFLKKTGDTCPDYAKNVEWALGRFVLNSEYSRNCAFENVSPVCFFECMCTIAIFELRRHFELNRVMQSDTKQLYGP